MTDPFRLRLSRQAQRALSTADASRRVGLARALDRLCRDPFDLTLDIRRLKGRPGVWRLRVGTWRVVYEVNLSERIVDVLRIAPRADVYR